MHDTLHSHTILHRPLYLKSLGSLHDEISYELIFNRRLLETHPKKVVIQICIDMANLRVIFFDLETTGADQRTQHDGIQICSMAASTYAEEGEAKKFLAYVKPTCAFQPIASRINGMTMEGDNLVKYGKTVETALSLMQGLQDFLTFIETVKDDEGRDTRIVLTAHNCFNFDAIVLLKNLRMFELQLPDEVVFGDTCEMMEILVEECLIPRGRNNYTLDKCLKRYFNEGQGDHDAESDTKNLIRVANRAATDLGFDTYESFQRSRPDLTKNVTI